MDALTKVRKEEIARQMQLLVEKAKEKKLWLYHKNEAQWFSPSEYEDYRNRGWGSFIWDPPSYWELRDPKILLDDAQEQFERAEVTYQSLKRRMGVS